MLSWPKDNGRRPAAEGRRQKAAHCARICCRYVARPCPPAGATLPARPRLPCLPTSLACLALSFSRLSPLTTSALTASPPTVSSGQPRHRCLAAVPCRSCRLCPSPPSQPRPTPYDRRTTAVSSFGGDTGGQPRLWPKTAQPSPCSRPVAHSPPSAPRPPLPSTLSLASASKVDLSTPPIRSTHPPALSSIRPLAPSTAKASLILVSQELRQRWPPCRSPLQLLNSLICR